MAASFQPTRRVNGQGPVEGGFSFYGCFSSFARRKKSQILGRDNFKRSEGVMDLGEVDALRRGLRNLIGPGGSNSCCQERGEIVSFPKAQGPCSLPKPHKPQLGFSVLR